MLRNASRREAPLCGREAATDTAPSAPFIARPHQPEHAEPPAASNLRRRRSLILVGVLTASVLIAGVAYWMGTSAQSPRQAAARAAEPAASWVTKPVEHRSLTDTLLFRGSVEAQSRTDVGAPSSVDGDAVVTRSVVGAGDELEEGSLIIEVSGRPVFVFRGSVPVYRPLRPGMSGPDVKQLQDGLTRLGFAPETDGKFGSATKAALESFYDQAGYEPVPVSETAGADIAAASQAMAMAKVALGDAEAALGESDGPSSALIAAEAARNEAIRALEDARARQVELVELKEAEYRDAQLAVTRLSADAAGEPDQLASAQQRVRELRVELDEVRRSTANEVAAAAEAVAVATAARQELAPANDASTTAQVEAARTAYDEARRALAEVHATNGPTVPVGEIVFVPQFPAHVVATTDSRSSVGSSAETGATSVTESTGALVELASGPLRVSTRIPTSEVVLLQPGVVVELLDEASSTTFAGVISTVSPEPVQDEDERLSHPATITPEQPLPFDLMDKNLRVTVDSASSDDQFLVVPSIAVSTDAQGATRVSVVTSPDDPSPKDVPVRAGDSAAGFVAIDPVVSGSIREGDLVVTGR